MVKDIVWQQFLLFCHRNGLYYGEQLDDTSALCWSSSDDDKECKIVRSLKQRDRSANDPATHGVKKVDAKPLSTSVDQKLMVVSSLERYLRK
jgi:hypothetical protein